VADLARADLVVTVCDHAHEELRPDTDWWHWSLPDPVVDGSPEAFDRTLAALDSRIGRFLSPQPS
jgi:protein-tyrosine-phosphatase